MLIMLFESFTTSPVHPILFFHPDFSSLPHFSCSVTDLALAPPPLYPASIIHPSSPPPSLHLFFSLYHILSYSFSCSFSIFKPKSHPPHPCSASPSLFPPESLIWYLSGVGPINPASLCLSAPPLIRMHTGDILLLLVVGGALTQPFKQFFIFSHDDCVCVCV